MTGQLSLAPSGGSIEEAFWRFHDENPHVYRELVRLAREWKDHRGDRLGISMLFEVLRWQTAMRTTGDLYQLNNSYRALYARLIMSDEPDLAGVFETRTLHAVDPFTKAAG